jgi:hypothetical protein
MRLLTNDVLSSQRKYPFLAHAFDVSLTSLSTKSRVHAAEYGLSVE